MKQLMIFISCMLLIFKVSYSQDHNIHPVSYIFNPNSDAQQNIADAIGHAAKDHKHVLLIIGGDWSFWSRLFYQTMKDEKIKKYVDEKYIVVLANFSPANRNVALLDSLGCPKDLGYPIVMMLDEKGKRLHMQNTDEYKVQQKWYNEDAILAMLKQWA